MYTVLPKCFLVSFSAFLAICSRYGAAAGFVSAVLCTATSVMHGGFMLYNGGLVAGLSAMILSPLIDHYSKRGEKLEGELMD